MTKDELIEFRKQRGWTQEELHYESGVNLQAIKDFENGAREMHHSISNVLYNTLKRVDILVEKYQRLSDEDKLRFQRKFNLSQDKIIERG